MFFGKKNTNENEVTENEFNFTANKVYIEGPYLKSLGAIGVISIPLNKIEVVTVCFKPPTSLNINALKEYTTEVRIVGCGTVLGELHAPQEKAFEIQEWIMEKLPA